MTDFNDPFEREKLFKKRKGLLDLLKERTRIANLDGRTPKKYNRFEQEIGGVDIEQYYQSGDPIGKRSNPVRPGAREQHDDPSNPVVNTPLQVRVYSSIKQSDGRTIDITDDSLNTSDHTTTPDPYANALKQRVALWSASSADSYDTVYVQYRPTYDDSSTYRTQYTTDTLESERSQQYFDSEGNEIAKRGGSAFFTDADLTTRYDFGGSTSFRWILLERVDSGAFFVAAYSNGRLLDVSYSGYVPPTPATSSIFTIDDGAGNIVNDGSDGFDIGYLAVDLGRVRAFDRYSDGAEVNLIDSYSLQPGAFKCTGQLDDFRGGGKSGISRYAVLTSELPLQTGSADAGTIIRSVWSQDNYWGPATSFDGTWLMDGSRSDLQADGTNTEALYIISASNGVVHEIYRIDDKSSTSGVRTVNDGSDGLPVCS